MFKAQVIGNLGADARVEQNNGRPFVSFNVAHNDNFTKDDGTKVERIQWISCTMDGDGGKLLPYLKKGRQVFIEGRCTTRVYSSEKERRMVAGVNIFVTHVELIGGAADEVPSRLFDSEGIMHIVNKSYWINDKEAAIILAGKAQETLMTPSGQRFILNAPCWVTPFVERMPQLQAEVQQENVEVFDGEGEEKEAAETRRKLSSKK